MSDLVAVFGSPCTSNFIAEGESQISAPTVDKAFSLSVTVRSITNDYI